MLDALVAVMLLEAFWLLKIQRTLNAIEEEQEETLAAFLSLCDFVGYKKIVQGKGALHKGTGYGEKGRPKM